VDVNSAHYNPDSMPQKKGLKYSNFQREIDGDKLDPDRRRNLFNKVEGLNRAIASFDELDRDLLLLRARKGDLSSLQKQYPSLPTNLLERLVEVSRK